MGRGRCDDPNNKFKYNYIELRALRLIRGTDHRMKITKGRQ